MQIGYSIFDASGKLISGTVSPTPATTAPDHGNELGR
jgi:hypothetical protein